MSETGNYPNFYQPSEGRPALNKEQLLESARVFNGLFDDLMLQHMEAVMQFESIPGEPTADLLKYIEVDGHRYQLALVDKGSRDKGTSDAAVTFKPSEIIKREISLLRIDDDGYSREYWIYRLRADGVVRRRDDSDVTAKEQQKRDLGIEDDKKPSKDASLEESKVLSKKIQDLTENTIPNVRFEEDMGVNNQPVAPEELTGLSDFLHRASYSD